MRVQFSNTSPRELEVTSQNFHQLKKIVFTISHFVNIYKKSFNTTFIHWNAQRLVYWQKMMISQTLVQIFWMKILMNLFWTCKQCILILLLLSQELHKKFSQIEKVRKDVIGVSLKELLNNKDFAENVKESMKPETRTLMKVKSQLGWR